MAASDPSSPPAPATERRERRPALVAGAILGGLVAVFAVLNSQSVEVNWILGTTRTPLIVVIVLFLLIGYSAAILAGRRGRRRPGGRRGRG
ncbi:MAG: hypothetical protein QOD61_1300 [Solirubrobacteraceae bacterium]|nr:hypothetical protein [Solirubrobacteraceae bacterium]